MTSLYGKACRRGFSLVEILIVVAIIGVLMTVVSFSVNSALQKARIARAQTEVRELATAFKAYYAAYDTWPAGYKPETADGLGEIPVTVELIEGLNKDKLLIEIPPSRLTGGTYNDPWKMPYRVAFEFTESKRENEFNVTLFLPMFERRTP